MKSLIKKSLFLKPSKAFTLIELMIVIAIIAILATIAIPSYTTYTQKAALSELLRASASYKSDVEVCIYNTGNVANCSGGSNIDGFGYTMTPTFSSNTISWKTTCTGSDTSLFPANFCSTGSTN